MRRIDDQGVIVGNFRLLHSIESIGTQSRILVECTECGYRKKTRRQDFYKSKGNCSKCPKAKKQTAVKPKKKRKNDLARMKRNAAGKKCANCGISEWNKRPLIMDVDHIIPRSRGGTDEGYNLQYICPNCHRQKTIDDLQIEPKNEFCFLV